MSCRVAAFGHGLLALVAVMGCSRDRPPDWPVSPPSQLCSDPSLGKDDFCLPAARIERWLKSGAFAITHAAVTGHGATAPHKMRVRITDPDASDISFSVKFKPVPDDFDNFNNSPRRELAAYQLQQLFLDENDYVVPPTILHCIALGDRDLADEGMLSKLEPFSEGDTGANCSLGILAYWLENVTGDDVLDEKRAARDRRYREHLGDLNALTILVGHQDNLGAAKFLLATDPQRPRVFSVDNGLSLDAMGDNPIRFFSSAWSDRRVDWMAERTVKRLRGIDRRELEKLSVLAQLEVRGDTIASVAETAPLDRNEGVRQTGRVLQLGLTAEEITDVSEHLDELLDSIASGESKVERRSLSMERRRQRRTGRPIATAMSRAL